MPLDVAQTLRRLVQIPSVNPMGRPACEATAYEHRLTAHLETLCRSIGLATARQPVEPNRENLLARLEGDPSLEGGGSLVLWEVHQDTVPVDNMTIEPFAGAITDGRLYGRGACDVKGTMAAMLAATARLAEARSRPRPTIVLAFCVNEEFGFSGVRRLAASLQAGQTPLLPRRPDAAIVAEPTQLDVVVAHKGVVRWRCHTLGRAAHSSAPERGANAIYRMAQVVAAFEDEAAALQRRAPHPGLGLPTLSVGTILGGVSDNTVPDHCTIEIDRRLLPEESPLEARRRAIDALRLRLGEPSWLVHDPPYNATAALGAGRNRRLAEQLLEAAAAIGRPSQVVAAAYATDAPPLADVGIPTVVFGGGSIDQAHTRDEWIALEQVELAAEVLVQFARRFEP